MELAGAKQYILTPGPVAVFLFIFMSVIWYQKVLSVHVLLVISFWTLLEFFIHFVDCERCDLLSFLWQNQLVIHRC